MNPLVKKLASQTAVYGLSTIAGRLLNYLLVPLYTRVFLPAQYGVITEMYAYVSVLNVLYTLGMETAFFRYFTLKRDKQSVFNAAFNILLLTTLVFTGLLWLGTPFIAQITHYTDHPEYIRWFIAIMALDTLAAIPFAMLRVQNRPMVFAGFKLVNIGVNVFFNVFFLVVCPVLLHHNYFTSVLSHVYNPEIGVGYVFIANLIASAVTLLCFTKVISKVSFRIDTHLLREMLYYGLPLVIVGLAGMVNETMDRLLLKYNLSGSREYIMGQVGIYGANYRLSILLTLFVQAFRMAAEPFFFNQATQTDSRAHYSTVMNYFVAFCCGIFLLVTLYIHIFKHFIGVHYYEGLRVVPILLMANLFLGVYYNLSIWYKLTHQNTLGAMVAVMGAVITLTINLWFIPRFSYDASAWATFLCYGSMMVVSYILGQKYFTVPYHLDKLLLCFTATLIIFTIGWWGIQPMFTPVTGSGFGYVLRVIFSYQTAVMSVLFAAYLGVVYGLFRKNLMHRFQRQ